MTERPLSFGDRVRLTRLERGWSQIALAKRADIDNAQVSRLESGERQNINIQAAKRIARALGVSLDYLVGMFASDGAPGPAGVDGMGVVTAPSVPLSSCTEDRPGV